MEARDKEVLIGVFSKPLEQLGECECRLLFNGDFEETGKGDSYQTVSWDRYFDDMSRGSFRFYASGDVKAWRSRVWHFFFKNATLIHRLFNSNRPERRILDIGCSSGFLRRLIEGNASPSDTRKLYYWGMDLRLEKLESALSDVDSVESGASGTFMPSAFIRHDMKNPLPFKDNSFDTVVNFEMIKYLPIAQGKALLGEIKRVLKNEGELYLSHTDYTPLRHQGLDDYMRWLTPSEVATLMEEVGLRVIDRFGSQIQFSNLAKSLRPEHVPLVKELLRVHPPELVAAMIGPLYPDVADQVTFVATHSDRQ